MGALVVGVAALHACTVRWAASDWHDLADSAAMPTRLTLVHVRELALSAPKRPVAALMRAAPTRAAVSRSAARLATAISPQPALPEGEKAGAYAATAASASAADSASGAASASDDTNRASAGTVSATATSAASTATAAAEAASAAAATSSATSSATADTAAATPPGTLPVTTATTAATATTTDDDFAWPQSTRVSYRLSGNYRGEVRGTAQVEWLLRGADYQMHMDIVIGVPFAPLLDRHLASAGRVGADGLVPERFDEDSKRAFSDRWRLTMRFAPDGIRVGEQRRYDRPPGVQDTVSQFGQLSWRFARHPELLTPGTLVDVPLALPRHLDVWHYRVLEPETLATPFGDVPTAHLMPTLPPGNGDLSAEIWVAPALRYLPVRIRIAQDASTYVDLLIDRRPEIGDAAP